MSSANDPQPTGSNSESVRPTIQLATASPFNTANNHEALDIAELPSICETPFKKVNSEIRASIANVYPADFVSIWGKGGDPNSLQAQPDRKIWSDLVRVYIPLIAIKSLTLSYSYWIFP